MKDTLRAQGWCISDEGLALLHEQLGSDATVGDLTAAALDHDLRQIGGDAPSIKGDTALSGPLVLQLLEVRNVAMPSTHHVEKPRLFRVTFTAGGKKKLTGVEFFGAIDCITLMTPPGSKFLVTKPIQVKEQLLLLGPGMLQPLGGYVQDMVHAWRSGKQFVKRFRGLQADGDGGEQDAGPPLFVPFKVDSKKQGSSERRQPKDKPVSEPARPDDKQQQQRHKGGGKKDPARSESGPSRDKKKSHDAKGKDKGSKKKNAQSADAHQERADRQKDDTRSKDKDRSRKDKDKKRKGGQAAAQDTPSVNGGDRPPKEAGPFKDKDRSRKDKGKKKKEGTQEPPSESAGGDQSLKDDGTKKPGKRTPSKKVELPKQVSISDTSRAKDPTAGSSKPRDKKGAGKRKESDQQRKQTVAPPAAVDGAQPENAPNNDRPKKNNPSRKPRDTTTDNQQQTKDAAGQPVRRPRRDHRKREPRPPKESAQDATTKQTI